MKSPRQSSGWGNADRIASHGDGSSQIAGPEAAALKATVVFGSVAASPPTIAAAFETPSASSRAMSARIAPLSMTSGVPWALSSNSGTVGPGSLGHPDLCNKPCVNLAAGACAGGASCTYCHLPHVQRPVHFSQEKRRALRRMRPEEVQALMFPLLREKVVAFDSSADTIAALDSLESRCQLKDPASSRSRLSLMQVMQKMSIRHLCRTFRGHAFPDDEGARRSLDRLTDHLLLLTSLAITTPPSPRVV